MDRRADQADVGRSASQQVSPVVSEPTSPLVREVANQGSARQPNGGDTFVVDNRRSQSGYRDDRQPLVVDGVPTSASLCGTAAVVRTVGQPPGDGTAVASEPPPVRNGDSAGSGWVAAAVEQSISRPAAASVSS